MNTSQIVTVKLHFVTCTVPEAIDEINCQLKSVNLHEINEGDLISQTETEHEDDWFDDMNFTFKTTFIGDMSDIIDRLEKSGANFEVIH